jgi:hypothetical protein
MTKKNNHHASQTIETLCRTSMVQAAGNPETEEKELPWPIEMLPVHSLRSAKRNARTHSKKQIREVADSIQRFGVMVPVIADGHRHIVAGHARVAAAKLLGLQHLPVIQVSHLNEVEIRAFALADNKLATKAGWDREILAIELQELQIALPEINLDISATGFDPGEIDSIMLDFADDEARRADEIPEIERRPTAQIGDLFELGRHRLIARDPGAFAPLMQGELAEMAFLDPPFNVRVHGHTGGRGRIKHREFECASGEMNREEFVSFLKTTLLLCAQNSADGAIHYICMDWRHVGELLEAGHPIYHELKNICAWVKTNGGSKNLETILAEALNEKVHVQEKGKTRLMTAREVIGKKIVHAAMKGDHKSITYLLSNDPNLPIGKHRRASEPASYDDWTKYDGREQNSLSPKQHAERAQQAYLRLVRGE